MCLRKHWWRTGERCTIKAQEGLEIWTNLPTSEVANLRPSILAVSEIWQPDSQASLPLRTYMRALPGREYLEAGFTLAATDGSLRLRRGSTREPTMGLGVAWADGATAKDRVGGALSSTRAELAAISVCLNNCRVDSNVAILCDSSGAIQRLRRFRSADFQPLSYQLRDEDVVRAVLAVLRRRMQAGARTVLVKTHGHSSDPLHTQADQLAVQGADRELEDDEAPLFSFGRVEPVRFEWSDDEGRERSEVWGRAVKQWMRTVGQRGRWPHLPKDSQAGRFLAREGAGRRFLGLALQRTWDWALRHWLLALTPQQYPSRETKARWQNSHDSTCVCGMSVESFSHLQLECGCSICHPRTCGCIPCCRAKARQMAHNRVARALEYAITSTLGPHHLAVWDSQLDAFLEQVLDSDLRSFLRGSGVGIAAIQRWRQARGGQQSLGPVPQHTGRKRTREEVTEGIEDDLLRLKPDGIIIDGEKGEVFVVEVARTFDAPEVLRNRSLRKYAKYTSLRRALEVLFPCFRIATLTFVIGILGSIAEEVWVGQLERFGIRGQKASTLLSQCMKVSIEGSYQVFRAGRASGGSEGVEGEV